MTSAICQRQARLDFAQACALLDAYELCRKGASADDYEREWPRLCDTWYAEQDLSKLMAHANDAMTAQLTEQFACLYDLDAGDLPVPAVLPRRDGPC